MAIERASVNTISHSNYNLNVIHVQIVEMFDEIKEILMGIGWFLNICKAIECIESKCLVNIGQFVT